MKSQPLVDLISDEFLSLFSYIATPTALYRALRRSAYVGNVKDSLNSGQITDDIVKTFVADRLKDLKVGEPFKFDLSIAALSVALERRSSDFAEEYLIDLSKLKLGEMPMSIRVARECLKNRVSLAKTEIVMKEMRQTAAEDSFGQLPVFRSYDDLAGDYPQDPTVNIHEFVC